MEDHAHQPNSKVTDPSAEPPDFGEEQYRAVLTAERNAAEYCRVGAEVVQGLDRLTASLEPSGRPSCERELVRAAIFYETRSFTNCMVGDPNDYLYLSEGMAPIVELVEYLRYLERGDHEPQTPPPTLSDAARRIVIDTERWFSADKGAADRPSDDVPF